MCFNLNQMHAIIMMIVYIQEIYFNVLLCNYASRKRTVTFSLHNDG